MIPGEMQQAFSEQDAQNLLTLVQTAPLANLHQARQVDQLCLRAQSHFAAYFANTGVISKPVESGKKCNGEAPEVETP